MNKNHFENNLNLDLLQKFSSFTFEIRQFFHQQGFLEAVTPTLVKCPGTEPFLEPFTTEVCKGQTKQKFYLPTSPEIHLKKILCNGAKDIFEIKNVFRNNEFGHHHEFEFLMLEWYRAGGELRHLQKDTIDLIRKVAHSINLEIRFEVKSMATLFREFLNFKLTPQTTAEEFYQFAVKNGLSVKKDDSREDLFTLIFVELIETKLNKENPMFITDYPPFQAAYAKINNTGWADRFELYWQGLEIANAFLEVTDADEQLSRMQKDNEYKKKIGKSPVDIDEEFIQLMRAGMPSCSGIALGVERLFMAIYQIEDIKNLKPFSANRYL